jgi:glutamine---fructose-6-phosphate transaminase (isomerizing)
MCGIVGCVGKENVSKTLLNGIRKLEYRGYDSCGIAISNENNVMLKKDVGDISKVNKKLNFLDMNGKIGMAHSRWATTGKVTKTNAHPHFSNDKNIFLVHNGIIENYEEMKKDLVAKGYKFISETDSEVIVHFIDEGLKQGLTPNEVMKNFIDTARGTFAVLWFEKNKNKLYAMKRDSPLVLGLCDNKLILASDIYAFSNETNKAIFFDDEEFAVLSDHGFEFFDCFGDKINKEISEFEWTRKEESREKYNHYMMKEIKEQPEVVERLVNSFDEIQKNHLKEFAKLIRESKRVVFLACGTSYHASLVGSFLLTQLGIQAHSVIASEFEHFLLVDKGTLVIPISQSGETMDVVTVLKDIKLKKAKIASIVNVPYSTVQRLSNVSIEILAGQEICVAATKSFTNQLVTLFAIAKELGNQGIELKTIPDKIEKTISVNEEYIKKLAGELYEKNDIFVLGRGMSYPIAREFALKLKEIAYVHAEGMMAGELKHGTIALVEDGTPIISLIPNGNVDMISNTKEVETRGARTIIVSNTNGEIHLPACTDAEFAIYSALIGHLLSYYIAVLRKLPIDKPRNLAKSVTVK